jgi:two-component system, LuxR family, sensor histidine kinase DctS
MHVVPTVTASEATLSPRWLLLLPRLAFGAFVIALAALLWFSHRQDQEEQRTTLITDMLWLEQNLRFQMTRNEELLGQLSLSEGKFEAQARALIANNTGLRQILIHDLGGRRRHAFPESIEAQLVGEAQGSVPSQTTLRLVQSLGSAAYAAPYPIVGSDWQIEVHVPVLSAGRPTAVAVGIYSLQRIVGESVPWWLAERYRIAVLDGNAHELAARSKVLPVVAKTSYELAFEPPGYGLLLSARPYQAPFPLIDRLLAVAVVLLALATLVSFWLVRKHVQQRNRAEEALRGEYRFRQAMERSVQTGLRARDLDGRILYVNDAFCRMVGWPAESLVGKTPPMPYWPEDSREEIQGVHDRILAGTGPTEGFELVFRRHNGELFTALIHEAPLIDDKGLQTGWIGSVLDISDRKAAEEAAQRQQERIQATSRLIAIGEVASGLAHELNQPLAAISSYCSGALRLVRDRDAIDQVEAALAKAVEQTQRAAQIIRRIYALARREGGIPGPIPLGDSVRSTLVLMDSLLKRSDIRVHDNIGSCNPVVFGDAVLIEQTVFNLLRNAIDAMKEIPVSDRSIGISISTEDGYAHLQVADSGRGITGEEAGRVFDPLYTTKAEGLGMGLAVCRSIIEGHKGRIWFERNPLGGTIFHITLPMSAI